MASIETTGEKLPHDIPRMLARIRKAVDPFAKAMLFDIAQQGYNDPFQQLAACLVSIRTRDEVSLVVSLRLLKAAPDARKMAALPIEELAELLKPSSFAYQKAKSLHEISRIVLKNHDGKLPCDFEALTALPGVGPKCANLVLGIACGVPSIGVDIHVHRVTNRWGYVQAKTPEKTMAALRDKLPRKHWVEINELLVPFGKHICTGPLPKCSKCPVLAYCRQVGVTRHA